MKSCPKCSRTSPDDAWMCRCGYEFDGNTANHEPRARQEPEPAVELAGAALVARTRPLLDPAVVASSLVKINLWLFIGVTAILVAYSLVFWQSADNLIPKVAALISLLFFSTGVSALFAQTTAWPVFYLRAFRSDLDAARLRRILRAAIGPEFRLTGIRSPRKRPFWIEKIFLNIVSVLRTLGTNYFELEAANHQWMPRLLASYATARMAFVDVRDLTPHVADEIRLTWLALGADRCVFITDSSRTPEQWRELIGSATEEGGDPVGGTYRLLEYPGDAACREAHTAGEFGTGCRVCLMSVPEVSQPDPERAASFALQRTPVGNWEVEWWEQTGGRILLAWLGGNVIGAFIGCLQISDPRWESLPGKLGGGAIMCFLAVIVACYAVSVVRQLRQADFGRRHFSSLGWGYTTRRLWRSAMFGLFAVAVPGALAVSFVTAASNFEKRQLVSITQHKLQQVSQALHDYHQTYDRFPWEGEPPGQGRLTWYADLLGLGRSDRTGSSGSHFAFLTPTQAQREAFARGELPVLRDAWDRAIKVEVDADQHYDLLSAGEDGQFATKDDIVYDVY